MPVNSFSFKINVPTSNIPIITSVAPTGYTPPSIIPSNAVPTNEFLPGTPGQTIQVPAYNVLIIIYPTVNLYRVLCRYNNSTSTPVAATTNNPFYYKLIPLGTSSDYNTIAFYGTDGVITDTVLYSLNDQLNTDNVTVASNISTKALLIDLPE